MRYSRTAQARISVAEYLALEETSLHKHEYVGGEIFTMNGASTPTGKLPRFTAI
jgi:hypothetical protein